MNSLLIILLCLFVSAGIAQIIVWLAGLVKCPKNLRRGYHIIPLYNTPDSIEAQLRYGLESVKWSSKCGEIILAVDMGMEAECQKISEEFIRKNGIFLCRKDDLIQTIKRLDELQSQ